MDALFRLVGLGLTGAVLAVLLRSHGRNDMAMLVSVACGIMILLGLIQPFSSIMATASTLMEKVRLPDIFFKTAAKVVGYALLCEIGVALCRDAGEGALAKKIEIAGKVLILVSALPILVSFADLISSLVP